MSYKIKQYTEVKTFFLDKHSREILSRKYLQCVLKFNNPILFCFLYIIPEMFEVN